MIPLVLPLPPCYLHMATNYIPQLVALPFVYCYLYFRFVLHLLLLHRHAGKGNSFLYARFVSGVPCSAIRATGVLRRWDAQALPEIQILHCHLFVKEKDCSKL